MSLLFTIMMMTVKTMREYSAHILSYMCDVIIITHSHFFVVCPFRSDEWFEAFYQILHDGVQIVSGSSFGSVEAKNFTLSGSEELVRK
jgi:hypothetical protein